MNSGSSQGPSPAQRVPVVQSMIHRASMATMHSLEELRRKSQMPPINRN